jgi:hypothetical protein
VDICVPGWEVTTYPTNYWLRDWEVTTSNSAGIILSLNIPVCRLVRYGQENKGILPPRIDVTRPLAFSDICSREGR